MKCDNIGATDLTVSEVGFGLWTVSTGWWGKVDKPDAIKLLRDAVEAGVTLFDTADTYGEGFGEEIMRALERAVRCRAHPWGSEPVS